TAVFVRDRLQEWGWKADLVTNEVLLNYPKGKTSLQINRPMVKQLSLEEAPLPVDKDSASSDAFGAFHGYGTSGIASGQVVYVNYARPEDFTALEKLGIAVKDKIVLARYGGNFRGLKVLNAQKHGARERSERIGALERGFSSPTCPLIIVVFRHSRRKGNDHAQAQTQ